MVVDLWKGRGWNGASLVFKDEKDFIDEKNANRGNAKAGERGMEEEVIKVCLYVEEGEIR